MKCTLAALFLCVVLLSVGGYTPVKAEDYRLVTILDSDEYDIYFGYLFPTGQMYVVRPREETEQRGIIEEFELFGLVSGDGRVRMFYKEDGEWYVIVEGTLSEAGELKFTNADGTYSYGFVDDISTPYRGGWNNMNADTDYDNVTGHHGYL